MELVKFVITYVIPTYLYLGFMQVYSDLDKPPFDRPFWANHPTTGLVLLVGLSWFFRPMIKLTSDGRRARQIAFGIVESSSKLAIFTFISWADVHLCFMVTHSIWIQVLLAPLSLLLCLLFLAPLLLIVMIPITFLISIPLHIIFPLPKEKWRFRLSCGWKHAAFGAVVG